MFNSAILAIQSQKLDKNSFELKISRKKLLFSISKSDICQKIMKDSNPRDSKFFDGYSDSVRYLMFYLVISSYTKGKKRNKITFVKQYHVSENIFIIFKLHIKFN